MDYLKPHTNEWFKAVNSINPAQAAMTKQIIGHAGKAEVCSVCGDEPASDYKVSGALFSPTIGATIRLCDDCRSIRQMTEGESYAPLEK
jgi:hypothetical protein